MELKGFAKEISKQAKFLGVNELLKIDPAVRQKALDAIIRKAKLKSAAKGALLGGPIGVAGYVGYKALKGKKKKKK